VPHPELLKAFGTFGTIPKMRVSEAPEGMVACLVGAGAGIDEPQLF
jgi:hypothetical protein